MGEDEKVPCASGCLTSLVCISVHAARRAAQAPAGVPPADRASPSPTTLLSRLTASGAGESAEGSAAEVRHRAARGRPPQRGRRGRLGRRRRRVHPDRLGAGRARHRVGRRVRGALAAHGVRRADPGGRPARRAQAAAAQGPPPAARGARGGPLPHEPELLRGDQPRARRHRRRHRVRRAARRGRARHAAQARLAVDRAGRRGRRRARRPLRLGDRRSACCWRSRPARAGASTCCWPSAP